MYLIKLIIPGILCFVVSKIVFRMCIFDMGLIGTILKTGISAVFGIIVYGLPVYFFTRKEFFGEKN